MSVPPRRVWHRNTQNVVQRAGCGAGMDEMEFGGSRIAPEQANSRPFPTSRVGSQNHQIGRLTM